MTITDLIDKIEKRLLKVFDTRRRIHLEKSKRDRIKEIIKNEIKEIKMSMGYGRSYGY